MVNSVLPMSKGVEGSGVFWPDPKSQVEVYGKTVGRMDLMTIVDVLLEAVVLLVAMLLVVVLLIVSLLVIVLLVVLLLVFVLLVFLPLVVVMVKVESILEIWMCDLVLDRSRCCAAVLPYDL
jgi:hypothetical protein